MGPEFPGEGAIPSIQYIAGSSLKYGSGNTPKKRKIECALVTHQKMPQSGIMQALYATPAWACCFLCIQFVCIIFLKV